ncbi:sulfate transporter CysZ [Aurantivibrio plasticivorans]
MNQNNLASGIKYFLDGVNLLKHPKLRSFLIIPILINTIVFFLITGAFFHYFDQLLNYLLGWLPDFLEFLAWIAITVLGVLIAVFYGYCFSAITNIIAAPFYGILAERTEEIASGVEIPDETLSQLIPRTIGRELTKLWYFLWRSLIVFILSFVPVIGPVLAIIWAMWSMAIQYSDYAADNHQTPFSVFRSLLRQRLWSTLGFGGIVMLCLMIPIINILVMPAAVIGGTLFWANELRELRS